MNTLETIEKRWGCKKFLDKPVDKESLSTVLDAGRHAPSAGNLQDRSFIVVKNKEMKSEIAKFSGNQSWMQTAPVQIVVVSENKKNEKFFGKRGEKLYSIQDAAFSAENMLLAATDLGLGVSLVVGFNEEKIKDILEIKEPARPTAIIVLGHAAEEAKTSDRYSLDRFVFFEKYDSKVGSLEPEAKSMQDIKEEAVKLTEKSKTTFKEKCKLLMEKIKSIFRRKEPIMEDHFLEPKPRISELKSETRSEIPRRIS